MRVIPRKLRTYRRMMRFEAEYFASLAEHPDLGFMAACAPEYRRLASLDRRQLRRLRRTRGAWLMKTRRASAELYHHSEEDGAAHRFALEGFERDGAPWVRVTYNGRELAVFPFEQAGALTWFSPPPGRRSPCGSPQPGGVGTCGLPAGHAGVHYIAE